MTSLSLPRRRVARVDVVLAVLVVTLAVLGLLPSDGTTSSDLSGSVSGVAESDAEQAYLGVARAQGVTGSAAAALSTARNVCADLNSGGDVRPVARYVAQRGDLDDGAARIVLRAAVHALCPVHEGLTGA